MIVVPSVFQYFARSGAVAGVAVGVYALIMLVSAQILNDPDSHWHLHVGQELLATGTLPRTDSYSHSFAGRPWIANGCRRS